MAKQINILYERHIPYLSQWLAPLASLTPFTGPQPTLAQLKHAHALIVRSTTRVDAKLVHNSQLQFVASVTAGIDHIDIPALQLAGIRVAHAPGCNATAVAHYVETTLSLISSRSPQRASVIGVGHVGTQVAQRLKQLGWVVHCYDPPRAERDPQFASCSWEQVCQSQLLCCHVPLTHTGHWPTAHMLSADILEQLPRHSLLIQASRGDVLTQDAITQTPHVQKVIDVWPEEPSPSTAAILSCELATPHIAGYSQQAKLIAAQHILTELCHYFQWSQPEITAPPLTDQHCAQSLRHISAQLKQAAQQYPQQLPAEVFAQIRRQYRY